LIRVIQIFLHFCIYIFEKNTADLDSDISIHPASSTSPLNSKDALGVTDEHLSEDNALCSHHHPKSPRLQGSHTDGTVPLALQERWGLSGSPWVSPKLHSTISRLLPLRGLYHSEISSRRSQL